MNIHLPSGLLGSLFFTIIPVVNLANFNHHWDHRHKRLLDNMIMSNPYAS